MPRYIVKIAGKYLEWSTVVDAHVTYPMTLDEFREYYKERYGTEGMRDLGDRLGRVETRGTSSFLHKSAEDTVSCNSILAYWYGKEPVLDENGFPDYSLPFSEIEEHVRNGTGPFDPSTETESD